MQIELSDQDRLRVQQGQPVDVIDARTNEACILIARQRFEPFRSKLTEIPGANADPPELAVPEGIRLSQVAFRRDGFTFSPVFDH